MEVYMQMDKRNQVGCEDTTKLSSTGVRFEPQAARAQAQAATTAGNDAWRGTVPALTELAAPARPASAATE